MKSLMNQAVLASLIVISAAACGSPPDDVSPAAAEAFSEEEAAMLKGTGIQMPDTYYESPLGPIGETVSSSEEVSQRLPFSADLPDSLQGARLIQVTRDGIDPMEAAATWAFDSEDQGKFVLWERVTVGGEAGQALIEQGVGQKEGCTTRPFTDEEQTELGPVEGGEVTECHVGESQLIDVNGHRAVLTRGPDSTEVIWLEALESDSPAYDTVKYPLALEVRIVGPTNRFTTDQAIAAAMGV